MKRTAGTAGWMKRTMPDKPYPIVKINPHYPPSPSPKTKTSLERLKTSSSSTIAPPIKPSMPTGQPESINSKLDDNVFVSSKLLSVEYSEI